MRSSDTTIEDLVALQKQGKSMVVVHGGGNRVTEWLKRQGITTEFVRGERVTGSEVLEVAIAILAGLINKEINPIKAFLITKQLKIQASLEDKLRLRKFFE